MSCAPGFPPTPHGASIIALTNAFEVTVQQTEGPWTTVQLRGEMDIATADLAAAALNSQLAVGCRLVRLDLSKVSFLDGSGLRVLVLAHNQFLAAGGRMEIVAVQPRIARVLRITQLDEALLWGPTAGPSLRAVPDQ